MTLKRVVAARSATYDDAFLLTLEGEREARMLADVLRPHLQGKILIFFSTLERKEEEFPAAGQTARLLGRALDLSTDAVEKLPPIGPDRALHAWRHIRYAAQLGDFETVILITESARAAALIERAIQHESGEPVRERYRCPEVGEALLLVYDATPLRVEMVSIHGPVKVL